MIVKGLVVTSARSVGSRVKVSPDRVMKEWVIGDIEYDREPQSVTPSIVPYEELAVSLASTVCVTAAKLTYASISVTAGSKFSVVVSQRSTISI